MTDWLSLEAAGRALIVLCFLVAALSNLTRERVRDHVERMRVFRTPWPTAAFWTGIGMQLAGCALLIADWHADIGVWLLIVFTVAATAIFHRFWQMEDPMKRNFSRLTFLGNTAILGGLLLLLDRVR